MIRFLLCSIYILFQFSSFSQEKTSGISQIESIDSLLIGKKLKRALKILDIDTNWTVIHEPPMIAQGVRSGEINGYKVQLITERIQISDFKDNKSKKIDFSKILEYKIIGISWETNGKCRSVGDIIPQYAYDMYGPCDDEKIQLDESSIFYSEIDTKRLHDYKYLEIDKQEYKLTIDKYCLNDNSVKVDIQIEDQTSGKLKPAIQVYHNYEVEAKLFRTGNDPGTIFLRRINKEIFKEDLSKEFYRQAVIFRVEYYKVKSKKIYFDVVLSVPDSDWQEEFKCSIFYKTGDLSKLEYRKVKSK